MRWNKFTLETTADAVDLISNLLADIGIEGIEIEDHIPLTEAEAKGMFIDILPDPLPDDKTVLVSFYLEGLAEEKRILKEIEAGLDEFSDYIDVGARTITFSEIEEKDWINNWKEFFKPFTVEDILIKPTWGEIPKEHEDKLLVQIDPGTAFGTGTHETTQLCIRQLRKYVTAGSHILDVGTGSGILGITALKLGAATVFGTDLDENSINAVRENLRANQIEESQFTVVRGNIINDDKLREQAGPAIYDIAVANILADVIILLQSEIAVHLKPGGLFIASGILDAKETAVRKALLANPEFVILETTYQGEWVSITARRR